MVCEDGDDVVPPPVRMEEEEREEGAGDCFAGKEDSSEGIREVEEEEDGGQVSPISQPPSYAESPLLSLAAAAARAERWVGAHVN